MSKTVLVVDDDEKVREVLAEALYGAGYSVVVERDGAAALHTFSLRPVDFVILDALLPSVNGFAVAERIRAHERGETVPILMVSGVYRGRRNREEAMGMLGVLDFLDKPLDLAVVVERVRRAIGRPSAGEARPPEGEVRATRQLALPAPAGVVPAAPEPEIPVPGPESGSLERTSFPQMVAWLARARATGVLRVRRPGVSKIIYFRDGSPVFVKSNLLTEVLGQVMVREFMIDDATSGESLRRKRGTGRPQGAVLVEMGAITPAQLADALRTQLEIKFFDVFGWREGEFEWEPREEVPPPTAHLGMTPLRMVLEGIRRTHDGAQARAALGERARRPVRVPETSAPRLLTPAERSLVAAADGTRTPAELAAAGHLPEQEAWRFLYALHCLGALEAAGEELRERTQESAPGQPEAPGPEGSVDEVYERLAATLEQMKRMSYFELLGVSPDPPAEDVRRAYLALAREYHPDRLYRKAAEEVRDVAGEIHALITTARDVLLEEGERERARSEAPGARPDPEQVARLLQAEDHFQRGSQLLALRQYRAALEAFRRAVECYPDEAEFHVYLAWSLFQSNPKDAATAGEAASHLRRAVERNPGLDRGWHFLGLVEKSSGRTSEAAAAFRRALEANPQNAQARWELERLE